MGRTRDNNNNEIKCFNLSNILKSCPKESRSLDSKSYKIQPQ